MPGIIGRFTHRVTQGKGGVKVTVVQNRFPIKGLAMKNGMKMIVAKIAADGQAVAQIHAPVDTGALRADIRHSFEANDSAGLYIGRVFTNMEYAIYQEYGTRFHGPTPFMAPAAMQMDNAAKRVMPALARMIENA